MKLLVGVAVSSTILFSGCAGSPLRTDTSVKKEDKDCVDKPSCDVDVIIADGQWVPDRITIKGKQKIRFEAKDAKFLQKGIYFDNADRFDCELEDKDKNDKVLCTSRGVPGEYKYSIWVWWHLPVDPWVLNK
jgi:hypothetical protein